MTPTEQDKELPDSIERILRFNCPSSCDGYGTYAEDDGSGNPIPYQCQWCYEYGMPAREAITADRKRVALEARISELNKIALDNYRGKTISESTNWQAKFEYFMDSNERRLAWLKAQQEEVYGGDQ